MVDDLAALLAWAAGATAPVVLVPEHSDGRAWVPTRQLVRLATDLVDEIGLRHAEVRTVPLEPHDPRSDSALLERIARRLDATEVYSLSDTAPAGTAEQWEHARLALVDGRADAPCPASRPARRPSCAPGCPAGAPAAGADVLGALGLGEVHPGP